MFQRKIAHNVIEQILTKPDGVIKQSRDKFIYYKKIKNRKDNMIAAVTLVKLKTNYEIITVMVNFEVKK